VLVPVVVNHGFTLNAVASFFLDDRRAVGGLTLLDHRSAVRIAVAVIISVTLPNGNTSRVDANAHLSDMIRLHCLEAHLMSNKINVSLPYRGMTVGRSPLHCVASLEARSG
jgi:hypothetical protein